MAESDALMVYVTAPPDQADRIAESAVAARAAACANVLDGVRSIYRWQGEIERESESLILFKTTRDGFERLADAVRAVHPYETPEIVASPISAGLPEYLDWVRENVASR